jgi:hypothetical protein
MILLLAQKYNPFTGISRSAFQSLSKILDKKNAAYLMPAAFNYLLDTENSLESY